MYAVTGITGKLGGIVARTLLAPGLPRLSTSGSPRSAKQVPSILLLQSAPEASTQFSAAPKPV
jgi:uncharacterized protein YbjT (DUF2867 family)